MCKNETEEIKNTYVEKLRKIHRMNIYSALQGKAQLISLNHSKNKALVILKKEV
jgi:CRISPR/Cas system-associated protein Cas10 (large subunit of type III CRISPR-Cas system)